MAGEYEKVVNLLTHWRFHNFNVVCGCDATDECPGLIMVQDWLENNGVDSNSTIAKNLVSVLWDDAVWPEWSADQEFLQNSGQTENRNEIPVRNPGEFSVSAPVEIKVAQDPTAILEQRVALLEARVARLEQELHTRAR